MNRARGILQMSFPDISNITVELLQLVSDATLRSISFKDTINSDFGDRLPKHLYMVKHLCWEFKFIISFISSDIMYDDITNKCK